MEKDTANIDIASLAALEDCVADIESTIRSLVALTVVLNADKLYYPAASSILGETEH